MNLGPQMADISMNYQRANFNTGHMGGPSPLPLILKIGLHHVLSWPKLDLKPKCHEAGTFGC